MKNNIYTIAIASILISCNSQIYQNGDLIFIEAENQNLSGAISRVTKDSSTTVSFDHIAMIEVNNKNKYIIETTTKKGSHKEPLKKYLKTIKKNNKKAYLYRLKQEYKTCIPKAIQNANGMLGKPYNYTYHLTDQAYYCSDFVEKAYRNCNIFQLEPMTFVNPKTKKIDQYWVDYYKKLNTNIPEGQLGCNPNGLAKSNNIYKVKQIK